MKYIRHAAWTAGFTIRRLNRETLRDEANSPVGGLLMVLERLAHDR
jgi:predicted TPR repeat methyltransferase